MTWPIHDLPTDNAALLRHRARQTRPDGRDRTARFACAVDVWAGNTHLWRSYAAGASETVDSWAERMLGPMYPSNHDSGRWGAPGIVGVADWPIPTSAALAGPMSVQAIHDLMVTLVVLGGGDMADVPPVGAISQRLARAKDDIVVAFAAGPISLRVLIGRYKATAAPDRQWRVVLSGRATRAGAFQHDLPTGEIAVRAASVEAALRLGKLALGIAGWPAQRVPGSDTWHLSRAPYRLDIFEVKGDSAGPLSDSQESAQ